MSELVFMMGVMLVLVNAQSNKQLSDIWDLISSSDMSNTNVPAVRANMFKLLGEIVFVVILSFISGASESAGKILTTLIVGLWIVWTMFHVKEMNQLFSALGGTK